MTKRILIVDDDPAIGSFIELIVGREGYEVKLVESAINLESVIGEFVPALIISDLMMPGRDG
ncbi:MAG: response regulator, partial [Chloroflexi bacterium]|nr:response regulator [Chloroflexota bacterium]